MPVSAARPGFQSTLEARLPLLRRESDGAELADTDSIMTALAGLADPVDRDGFDAYATECRQALAALRLHTATGDEVTAQLTDAYGPDPARWTGLAAGLAFDTPAARTDHPVYPTGRSRSGLTEGELRSYAPEFHQRFPLRWLAVPRDRLTVHGPTDQLPWPTPSSLGLPPGLDDTHRAVPVHPLTAGGPLRQALRDTGLDAHLAETPHLEALPTLSMRTVALTAHPGIHLKLPLATATLGRLNRRTIKPGTLIDGAAAGRLLETVIGRTPRFRDTVLLADESTFVHAGHELLAVLVRRYPAGLDETTVVPMAALLGPSPGGGLVIDRLADRFYTGDPVALLDAVLTLLLDWQTTLFGHGIALESHRQNISLLLDREQRPHPAEAAVQGQRRPSRQRGPDAGIAGPGRPGPGGVRRRPESSRTATNRSWTCSPPSPSICVRAPTPSVSPGTGAHRSTPCSLSSVNAWPKHASASAPVPGSREPFCAPMSSIPRTCPSRRWSRQAHFCPRTDRGRRTSTSTTARAPTICCGERDLR